MAGAQRRWAAEILHVWFHKLSPADWWVRSEAVDAFLQKRFAHDLHAMSSRGPAEFLTGPRSTLAAIVLFDQIPRNLFRADPRAFAFDPLAAKIANGALDRGYEKCLPGKQAQFLAMPLMHSEDVADQQRSLSAFGRINGGSNLSFARSHHRMIARFGRFPHRNDVLGRTTTSAELHAINAGFAW